MSIRRKLLYGFTAFVLLTLAVNPATGWVVRLQAYGTFGKTFPVLSEGESDPTPQDFEAQFATALEKEKSADEENEEEESARTAARLFSLCKAYPTNVPVRAAYLCFACDRIDDGHYEAQYILNPRRVRPSVLSTPKNHPEDLARFETIAREGERIDPQNGFFPAMLAYALYARNQDEEAFAAIRLASEMPTFDDYSWADVEAVWQSSITRYGQEIGGLSRYSSIIATQSYRSSLIIRSMARTMVADAITLELAGHCAEGLAIRKTVTRFGATLRTEATSGDLILTGCAITEMASTRPGGVYVAPPKDEESDARRERLRDAYCAYLTQLGEQKEANYFRVEVATREQSRQVFSQVSEISSLANPDVEHLFPLWGMVPVVTASLGELLAFAGLFALLHRFSRRTQEARPMSSEAIWGVSFGVVIPLIGIGIWCLQRTYYAELTNLAIALSVLLSLQVPLLLRFRRSQFGRGLGIALLTVPFLCVLSMMMIAPLKAFVYPFGLFFGGSEFWANTEEMLSHHDPALRIATSLLLLPFLLIAGLAIFSRVRRVPVSVGVTRSYQAVIGPILAFVLLGHAGLTVVTAYAEARTRASLSEMVRNEAKYFAHITGMPLPAPAPRP